MKLFFFILTAIIFISAENLYAARVVGTSCNNKRRSSSSCCPRRKSSNVPVKFMRGKRINLSQPEGREARKDYLEQRMRKEEPGSKKYMKYKQEREQLALDDIHESQSYLLERTEKKKKKMSKNERERRYLLETEANYLMPVLRKIEKFPFANQMKNIFPTIEDIKNGNLDFENCKGKSDSKILKTIHEVQKDLLKKYHKEFMKKNF